jgi:hypothetical protein
MASRNPIFGILWLILLFVVAWPVAGFLAGIWMLLQVSVIDTVTQQRVIGLDKIHVKFIDHRQSMLFLLHGVTHLWPSSCNEVIGMIPRLNSHFVTDNNCVLPFTSFFTPAI